MRVTNVSSLIFEKKEELVKQKIDSKERDNCTKYLRKEKIGNLCKNRKLVDKARAIST